MSFCSLLFGLLAIVYWGARALQKVVDFPERVRLYRARREEIGGQQALVEAVRSLLEGRFARAEKAARAAQSSTSTAAVAALIGARAAHRMQEYERRDNWLHSAEDDPNVDTARLVASAEMWTEQRENDAALGAIERLRGIRRAPLARTAHCAQRQSAVGPMGGSAQGTALAREARCAASGAGAQAQGCRLPRAVDGAAL